VYTGKFTTVHYKIQFNQLHCKQQEIQLSLTNHATHMCNMQWRGWPKHALASHDSTPNLVILSQIM